MPKVVEYDKKASRNYLENNQAVHLVRHWDLEEVQRLIPKKERQAPVLWRSV